jgi:hypothetical protein
VGLAGPARAGFLLKFSGNTAPSNGDATGTINFAVLNRDGGTAKDPWMTGSDSITSAMAFQKGTGSPALDTDAQLLYLFQVTNDVPADSKFFMREVFQTLLTPVNEISSWGYWTGLGLSDASGEVTSANFFGTLRALGNPASASVGVNKPKVVGLTRATYQDPSNVKISDALKAMDVTLRGLPGGGRTSIFGFTTNVGPDFAGDRIESAKVGGQRVKAAGRAASPSIAPEPPGLLLLLIGGAVLGGARACSRDAR